MTISKNPCRARKKVVGNTKREKTIKMKVSEAKEWENTVCSVCVEFPHKAALLLCSSFDKGCRPYMCATSHHFLGCLENYTKNGTLKKSRLRKSGWPDVTCPLCRGQVKGWTVVEPARRYFNRKKRTCMKDNCSFIGTYKVLKKHVKLVHSLACPRDVDPSQAEKWKKLGNDRDQSDVLNTIRSIMPGAIISGDYVIESWNHRDYNSSPEPDHEYSPDYYGSY